MDDIKKLGISCYYEEYKGLLKGAGSVLSIYKAWVPCKGQGNVSLRKRRERRACRQVLRGV